MASSKSQNLLHFLDCSGGGDPGYLKVINEIYQNKNQVNMKTGQNSYFSESIYNSTFDKNV